MANEHRVIYDESEGEIIAKCSCGWIKILPTQDKAEAAYNRHKKKK
jgi:hypothetical protein